MQTILNRIEIVEAYIYHRTGEDVKIDIFQIMRHPIQMIKLNQAHAIALSWLRINAIKLD